MRRRRRLLAVDRERDGFDVLGGRDLATGEPIVFPEIPEGVYSLSCSKADSTLIVGINGWRTPGDIYAIDLVTGATKLLVGSNLAGIREDSLIRPESITMLARDGVELQGLLYLPKDLSKDRLKGTAESAPPVIFEVHGGPQRSRGRTLIPYPNIMLRVALRFLSRTFVAQLALAEPM